MRKLTIFLVGATVAMLLGIAAGCAMFVGFAIMTAVLP